MKILAFSIGIHELPQPNFPTTSSHYNIPEDPRIDMNSLQTDTYEVMFDFSIIPYDFFPPPGWHRWGALSVGGVVNKRHPDIANSLSLSIHIDGRHSVRRACTGTVAYSLE